MRPVIGKVIEEEEKKKKKKRDGWGRKGRLGIEARGLERWYHERMWRRFQNGIK